MTALKNKNPLGLIFISYGPSAKKQRHVCHTFFVTYVTICFTSFVGLKKIIKTYIFQRLIGDSIKVTQTGYSNLYLMLTVIIGIVLRLVT